MSSIFLQFLDESIVCTLVVRIRALLVSPSSGSSWKAEDPVFGCGYMRSGCTSDARQVHRDRVRRRRLWERLQRRQSRLTRFASHHHHSARAILRFCKIAQLWGGGAFRTPPSALWNCGRSWGTRSSAVAGSTYVCANFCHPAAVAFEKCILNGSSCPENRTESELRGRRRGRGHRCAAKGGGTILITCQSGPAWTLSNNFASFTLCSAAKSAVNSLSYVLTHFGISTTPDLALEGSGPKSAFMDSHYSFGTSGSGFLPFWSPSFLFLSR